MKLRIHAKHLALIIVLIALSVLSACATNPVTGKQDFVLMSEEKEIALGRQANQQILKQYRVYDNPALQRYVSDLVEELSRKSHRENLVFHVQVLDSPQVNAFALPGGYVYITRGIMAYMNSEAELAGVLGHEIGHVTARHGVKQHSASTATNILATIVGAAAGVRGAGELANVAGTALVRGYGREHELEADRLGAEYIARVGYDPEEMINVVGILKSQEEYDKKLAKEEGREPRGYHGLFSTHPANDRRLQEVIRAANRYPSAGNRPANRDKFLKAIDGLTLGSSEKDGIVRDHKFYHKDLGITLSFPKAWKIDNLPDRLIASTQKKDAVIQVTIQDLNKRLNPKQYMEEKFGDKVQQGRNLNTPSYKGYTGLVNMKTPFGDQLARVTYIFKDKQVYQFLAAGKDPSIRKKYDGAFISTAQSLRALKRSEEKFAKPRKIVLIKAKRGDTFAKLAKSAAITSHAEDQLRLLNGMFPSGEPKHGQLIKTVR